MRRLSTVLAFTLAAFTLAACAGPPEPGDDEFADIDFSTADKADTVGAPTLMGALVRNVAATHSLVATTSGYHLYTLDGTAGERLHLTLDSTAFRTYLRVTTPSGARTSVSGVTHAGGWRSAIDPWVLPESGRYQILATAYANMQTHPVAKAHGSYTLLAKADPQTLTVAVVGSGSVTSAPAGVTCPGTCAASFAYGSMVTLTATPGSGNHLAGWSGACTGTAATCTVAMTAARTASAMFATNSYVLSTTVTGSGGGTLAVSPAGTSCGAGCATYAAGTVVTVTATPAAGAHFVAWSGDCAGSGATCTLTMTTARSVTAAFAVNSYVLTTNVSGGGTVVANPAGTSCGAGCYTFAYGSAVTLTATPAAGFHFAAWGGDCTGTATCSLVMTAARSVTASFVANNYTLTISQGSGNGWGIVTSNLGGIDCGLGIYRGPLGTTHNVCSTSLPYGTTVVLTTAPSQQSEMYAGAWTGCDSVSGSTCSLVMTGNRAVTASYYGDGVDVSIVQQSSFGYIGNGRVTSVPTGVSCQGGAVFSNTCRWRFHWSSAVTLHATPDAGSVFNGWQGCDALTGGAANDCVVYSYGTKQVTATFQAFIIP